MSLPPTASIEPSHRFGILQLFGFVSLMGLTIWSYISEMPFSLKMLVFVVVLTIVSISKKTPFFVLCVGYWTCPIGFLSCAFCLWVQIPFNIFNLAAGACFAAITGSSLINLTDFKSIQGNELLRNETSPQGNELLKSAAFGSALCLFLHFAAVPVLLGMRAVQGVFKPNWLNSLLPFLMATGIFYLATLCLSANFYLVSKRSKS